MTETLTVRLSHRYDAASERVFDAWLDPARAGKFLFATPTGIIVKCEIDPRVGGGFLIVDRRPDMGDVEHYGRFVEIERPRRLVFDFALEKHMKGSTRVTIDIAPAGAGCELTLTHVGILPDYAQRTESGWRQILAGLARATLGG